MVDERASAAQVDGRAAHVILHPAFQPSHSLTAPPLRQRPIGVEEFTRTSSARVAVAGRSIDLV